MLTRVMLRLHFWLYVYFEGLHLLFILPIKIRLRIFIRAVNMADIARIALLAFDHFEWAVQIVIRNSFQIKLLFLLDICLRHTWTEWIA